MEVVMKCCFRFAGLGVLLLFIVSPVSAQMHRWVDETGKVRFTDEPSQIPEQFRDQGSSKPKKKDPGTPKGFSQTPLHRAALMGDRDVVDQLISQGSDINEFDGDGKTAMHYAAERGRLAVVKLLLNMRARYDIKTQNKETPADMARNNGHDEIAGLLDRHARKQEAKNSRRSSISPSGIPGAVEFNGFEFVEVRGRTGHQGLFKSRHPLVAGARMKGKATIFGDLTDIRVHFIGGDGAPLKGAPRTMFPAGNDSWNYLADFKIPSEPFQVVMTAKDKEGKDIQKVFKKAFAPNLSLSRIFIRTPTDQRGCATAQSLFSHALSAKTNTGEILFISCQIPAEDDPIQDLNIDWTAYAASPAKGKNAQVAFSPPPEQKLTGNRCWSAVSLLDSLKKEGQRKALSYSWEADCQGGGKTNVLTLDLTLTSN